VWNGWRSGVFPVDPHPSRLFIFSACVQLGQHPLLVRRNPDTYLDTNTPIPTPTPPALSQLQLNLQVGDVYRVRVISDQVITQDLDGQSEETQQSIGYEYRYTIREVDADGNLWVDTMYDWVFVEQGGSLGTMTYDSANPPEVIPQEATGYAALVGKGFSMRLSPTGEVLDVAGLSEMYSQIVEELAPDDPETGEVLEQLIEDQFGEEAIKSQAGEVVFAYPPGKVEIGDSWTSNIESTLLVPMQFDNVYTLETLDGQTATITIHSTVSPVDDSQTVDLGFMQLSYVLEGTQEGTTQIDTATGWTRSSTLDQHLSGVMTIIADGEEFEVPITLVATTTVTTLTN
jgi:hypothetical protein